MKKYLLFATAALALASCTNETYLGSEEDFAIINGARPISFGFDVPAATRADNTGAAAATALGNQFIVYGEKSETTDGAAPVTDGSDPHQLVYKNYVVEYTANTASTTTSNTKNWEYVGLTQGYGTNVTPQAGETQTIKYWDYSATNYVFTAFSALQSDLSSGKVKVTKTTAKTDGNKVFDKGYTVVLDAAADPTKLYFSDRTVVTTKNQDVDRNAVNQIGGNVTLKFRNGVSQVRAAMYETIPGYQVEIDQFYYANAAAPAFSAMSTPGTDKFYANVPNLTTDKAATLTVTYYEAGERLNQPKIAVTGTANNYLALGTNLKDGTTLGENIGAAVYDKSDKSFTYVFPQESNSTNLKLKLDYTLKNSTTGETIHVTGATAEVPKEYLRWKGNFKYTYIFKISDNTNGYTGGDSNPAGLYPITFDAVEVVAEDGQAEYITTVSEPSITTFGVKVNSSNEFVSYVTGGNEYTLPTGTDKLDIYATFMEGSTVKTPTVGGTGAQSVNVYKVTCADETYITEAAVAEELAETFTGTHKLTVTNVSTDGTTNFSAAPAAVTTVPGEDGITINQNAVKLTGVKVAGYYAIEYEASAVWTGTYKKVYKVIKVTAAP